MSLLTTILAALTALESFYIMYLETFATASDTTARVFGMEKAELERPSVNTLFKNQGIYNGLIGVLILTALFVLPDPTWLRLLLAYVILVACYGGWSSNPKIILKQGGLPILALICSFF